MIKYRYDSSGWRPDLKGLRVIDIGGANSFNSKDNDAVIDIREPLIKTKHTFVGNIDEPEIWENVLKHVAKHGKWDYAICTHTLEDIHNPIYVCKQIEKIAKKGLIVEPSKFRELSKFSGNFRGFIHHNWIFDIRDGELIALPKINYIEDPYFNKVSEHEFFEELIIEWEAEIGLKHLNNGQPYGTNELSGEDHIKQLYNQLL
jgi:hypothetical protein